MKPAIQKLFKSDYLTIIRPNKEPEKGLITKDYCEERSKFVKNVSYDITIALTRWAYYFGTNTINFTLRHVPEELCIDFAGSEISSVEVNGSKVDAIFSRNKIRINSGLQKGKNTVKLSFYNQYKNNS